MPRAKKDAVRLSVKLDREISELLDEYCEKTGENKTMAVESILGEKLKSISDSENRIRNDETD